MSESGDGPVGCYKEICGVRGRSIDTEDCHERDSNVKEFETSQFNKFDGSISAEEKTSFSV